MTGKKVHVRIEWRCCRGSDIQLCGRHRKRSAKTLGRRDKSKSRKPFCSRLIVRVKKYAPTGMNHGFPSRIVANDPSYSQARSKVIPGRSPKRRTSGSERQRAGIANAPNQRIGIVAVSPIRRWVNLPANAKRQIE